MPPIDPYDTNRPIWYQLTNMFNNPIGYWFFYGWFLLGYSVNCICFKKKWWGILEQFSVSQYNAKWHAVMRVKCETYQQQLQYIWALLLTRLKGATTFSKTSYIPWVLLSFRIILRRFTWEMVSSSVMTNGHGCCHGPKTLFSARRRRSSCGVWVPSETEA